MQFALRGKPRDYGLPQTPASPWPDFVFGCGRQAVAPLLAIKAAAPGTFTTYIQDPHVDPARFDLVIAPDHDALSGPNVEVMTGSPNRVTRERIVKSTLAFSDRLERLPMPRLAVMIGGPSKTHTVSKASHETHRAAVQDGLKAGYSVMISVSRRTPDWVVSDYAHWAASEPRIWLYDGTEADNPYFAFLGGAEALLVTEDSTNMLTEACATGKPVYRLPMDGNPGKFTRLYDALENRCQVKLYDGTFKALPYAPLNETSRMAEQFWAHIDKKTAILN